MKTVSIYRVFLYLLVMLVGLTACAPAEAYNDPPKDLQESDLVGTWEAQYGSDRIDRLLIRDDGLFQQIYEDLSENYLYESGWNAFQLEPLTNGSKYIHFDDGRYYPEGIRIAELDGMGEPCPVELPDCYSGMHPREFYDPYTNSLLKMQKQLILTIRLDNSELVFHHLWTSQDRGFAILGGQKEVFRRVNETIPDGKSN